MTASAATETANYSEKYHEPFEFPDNGDFASDESGVGTIETVLILVVLISLVLITFISKVIVCSYQDCDYKQ